MESWIGISDLERFDRDDCTAKAFGETLFSYGAQSLINERLSSMISVAECETATKKTRYPESVVTS